MIYGIGTDIVQISRVEAALRRSGERFAEKILGPEELVKYHARRAKNKVSPLYPELARKMNLSGVVKIAVTVAPNGTVKDTKVIGGNPILVNAALDAVKKWKFDPASDESVGVIEFKFDPSKAGPDGARRGVH